MSMVLAVLGLLLQQQVRAEFVVSAEAPLGRTFVQGGRLLTGPIGGDVFSVSPTGLVLVSNGPLCAATNFFFTLSGTTGAGDGHLAGSSTKIFVPEDGDFAQGSGLAGAGQVYFWKRDIASTVFDGVTGGVVESGLPQGRARPVAGTESGMLVVLNQRDDSRVTVYFGRVGRWRPILPPSGYRTVYPCGIGQRGEVLGMLGREVASQLDPDLRGIGHTAGGVSSYPESVPAVFAGKTWEVLPNPQCGSGEELLTCRPVWKVGETVLALVVFRGIDELLGERLATWTPTKGWRTLVDLGHEGRGQFCLDVEGGGVWVVERVEEGGRLYRFRFFGV